MSALSLRARRAHWGKLAAATAMALTAAVLPAPAQANAPVPESSHLTRWTSAWCRPTSTPA